MTSSLYKVGFSSIVSLDAKRLCIGAAQRCPVLSLPLLIERGSVVLIEFAAVLIVRRGGLRVCPELPLVLSEDVFDLLQQAGAGGVQVLGVQDALPGAVTYQLEVVDKEADDLGSPDVLAGLSEPGSVRVYSAADHPPSRVGDLGYGEIVQENEPRPVAILSIAPTPSSSNTLTSEPLMHRYNGEELSPLRLPLDKENLELADEMISTFRLYVGKERFELDQELLILERTDTNYRIKWGWRTSC